MPGLIITSVARPAPEQYFGPVEAGFLDWETLLWRFAAERSYWLSSADGAPHAMPVWGIWQNNAFKFSTASTSKKAMNLRANPVAVVHTANTESTLIMECNVTEIANADELHLFIDEYNPKYKWAMTMDDVREGVFSLTPFKAFAWSGGEGDAFSNTATRWTFDTILETTS